MNDPCDLKEGISLSTLQKTEQEEDGAGTSTYHMTFSCNKFSFSVNVAANQSLWDSLATTLKPTFHKDTTQHCPSLFFFFLCFSYLGNVVHTTRFPSGSCDLSKPGEGS